MKDYYFLNKQLSEIEAGIKSTLADLENWEEGIDTVVNSADSLVENLDQLRENNLNEHERELLGLIQLAVAAELAPLEWVERRGADADADWEDKRQFLRNKIGVDPGSWEEAAQIDAIRHVALPFLQELKPSWRLETAHGIADVEIEQEKGLDYDR